MGEGGDRREADVEAYIKVGVDWAASNHVPLIMTEFGASNVSNPTSRYAWITFMKSLATKYGYGWNWYSHDSAKFGIRTHHAGAYSLDTQLIQVLSQ